METKNKDLITLGTEPSSEGTFTSVDGSTVMISTDGDDMHLTSIGDDLSTDPEVAPIVLEVNAITETKPKRRRKKSNAKRKLADPKALEELVSNGLTGTGLSTRPSHLTYVMVDDWAAIRKSMARVPTDPDSIQVLTHAHNCIHSGQGFSRSIFRLVPNLAEADKATAKNSGKLGTYTLASLDIKGSDTKTFVNTLYVQFCMNEPHRGAPENNQHVNLRAVRNGMRSIFKMYPEATNHGLVIFGEDSHYPTNWSNIEDVLEDLCAQLGTKLTIFVPRFYIVNSNQKLDGRLSAYLRSVGYHI